MLFIEIKSKLDIKKQEAIDSLVNGNCSDHSSYKHLVGYLRGIKVAEEIIQEMLEPKDE